MPKGKRPADSSGSSDDSSGSSDDGSCHGGGGGRKKKEKAAAQEDEGRRLPGYAAIERHPSLPLLLFCCASACATSSRPALC
jgi:hypothetical protein